MSEPRVSIPVAKRPIGPGTEQLILRAIAHTAGRGAPGKGCGHHVASYLRTMLADDDSPLTTNLVNGYLKNLEGAIRELRSELRAIDS